MKLNKRKYTNTVILIAIIIISMIIITVTSLAHFHQSNKRNMNHTKVPIVTVIPVVYHLTTKTTMAYGTTVSPRSIVIRSQDNALISEIEFQPGQAVKKGQLLFRLNVSDIGNQSQKLKAQMLQAKSGYHRLEQMNKTLPGSISEFDLLKAKSQYQQVLAAYKEVSTVENIRAAIDGTISDTHFAVGDFVNGGEILTKIVDPNSLQIKYQLPNQYANQVHLGQMIRFYPDGDSTAYSGRVSYIAPQFDGNNYGLTLKADLDKLSNLRPNHFGRIVQVLDPHYKTLAIPQGLVKTDAQGFYVYVLNKDKVNKCYFKAGEVSQAGLIQVLSGIKAQTLIINSNLAAISPGQAVQVAPQKDYPEDSNRITK